MDASVSESPVKPMTVLVAEDNPINQAVVVRYLRKRGHDVTVANDGQQALEAWRGGQFDLILMDIMMPEMDGMEATRAIRAEEVGGPRHIPIIAVTANAMQGDRERCLESGMDGYVAKPLKFDVLMAEIDRVLGQWVG